MISDRMNQITEILRSKYSGQSGQSDHIAIDDLGLTELLQLARAHGVEWLTGMELLNWLKADDEIFIQIRNNLRASSVAALRNCADLLRVEEICRQNGIRVVFFKGAALAAALYGNVAARRFGDIDLLVSSYADAAKLRHLLLDHGFCDQEKFEDVCADLKKRYHIEFQMSSPAGVGLDIHWQLFHGYFLQLPVNGSSGNCSEELNNSGVKLCEVDVCGRQVQTLTAEDNLIVLAAHHTTHCWNELRLVCDIAGIVSRFPEIDYGRAFARARRCGAARMLATGLRLAQLALAIELPAAAILELHRDRPGCLIAGKLWQRLRTGKYTVSKSEIMLLEIACRDSWWQRFKFIWQAMLEPSDNDFRVVQLTGRLWWLYYLIRPLRQIFNLLR